MGELIIYSLDILRPRIHAVSVEARRTISQYILQPLIDKIVFDRILESVIKIVDEMVRSGDNVCFSLLNYFEIFEICNFSMISFEFFVFLFLRNSQIMEFPC